MSTINRNNYEEYFIDYLDGNLSSENEEILLAFLDENPDLKDELESMKMIPVEMEEEISFSQKYDLKKDSTPNKLKGENIQDFLIAKLENDLNTEEVTELDSFLDQSEYWTKELKVFEKIKLEPDTSIVYRYKSNLKKNTGIFNLPGIYKYASVAASAAILLGLYFTLNRQPNIVKDNSIAKLEEIKKEKATEEKSTESTQVESKSSENKVEITQEPKLRKLPIREVHVEYNKVEVALNLNIQEPRLKIEPILMAQAKSPILTVPPGNEEKYVNIHNLPYYYQKPLSPFKKVERFLVAQINEKVFKKEKGHPGAKSLTMWDVADAGVDRVNKIFKSKMELKQIYDQNGNLTAVDFNSKLLSFHTPVKKDE